MRKFDQSAAVPLAKASTAQDGKAIYSSPVLRTYGSISQLTLGGAGSQADGNMANQMSDRRAKENIVKIGMHPMGFGLYLFDYKAAFKDSCGHGRQFGVMADEVEGVVPAAVVARADGYRAVNYALLGISHA